LAGLAGNHNRYKLEFSEDRFYSHRWCAFARYLKIARGRAKGCAGSFGIAREKEAGYLPLIAQVEPINTVVGVARDNHGKIPMAVASGAPTCNRGSFATPWHSSLFDAVVTKEDVVNKSRLPTYFLKQRVALGCLGNFAAL